MPTNHSSARRAASLFAAACCLLGFNPVLADDYPANEMSFENFSDAYGARIERVSCCSPKDGKVVVAFAKTGEEIDGPITASVRVHYAHSQGSGDEWVLRNVDVTKFVDFGEVRYSADTKHPGRYEVSMEFFHDGATVAAASFTQIKP